MKPKRIVLRNNGPVKAFFKNLYYPRLQVNKHGEIILAISKDGELTKGILVGKTRGSKSQVRIGQLFDDWEVCGEFEDYDGEVTVRFRNKLKRHGEVSGMRFIDKYKGCSIYQPYRSKEYAVMVGWDFVQQPFPSIRACKRYIKEQAA